MRIMPEHAWITREWVRSRKRQKDIAIENGINRTAVCSAIREFITRISQRDSSQNYIYGKERKLEAERLMKIYEADGGKFQVPAIIVNHYSRTPEERAARYEHAWLLRAEGATFKEIGSRLGVNVERARQMVLKFGRKMHKATRRMRMVVR